MPLPAIPRRVKIGDAAAFAGTTPRAIRHYHAIGLLAEPERGGDDRRRYAYGDMIRLLWIRRMADAGVSLEDIRAGFEGAAGIEQSLARLEESLTSKAAAIEAQRAAVHRLRKVGSPLGLLSPLVSGRLHDLAPGALRPADLDALLVTERILAPWAPPSRPTGSSSWPPTPSCGPRRTAWPRPRRPWTTPCPPTTPASITWLPGGVPMRQPWESPSTDPAWTRPSTASWTKGTSTPASRKAGGG